MSEQSIQSQDIKIADVFKSFYVVPDYQREYVWQAEQVEQLLADINNELAGATAGLSPEYFIGSIVVCPGLGGTLDLIDGQQRMTTLFLTLCAIRDRLIALGAPPSGALQHLIAAGSDDESGNECFRYRLDLQYEDSGGILEKIGAGKLDVKTTGDKKTTRSISNILTAYQTATSFLNGELGNVEKDIRQFYGYLTNKVKLIRIQTEDVAKALKIFETINDRGIGLDSMDLLKNLLFMKADRSRFDKLKGIWKQLQDTIHNAGEKPLRFLRYFIFSEYDVDLLREDEIYGWLSKNSSKCGYSTDPIGFADKLLAGAVAYSRFLSGQDDRKHKRPSIESLNILAGTASRQHLILLLAGRHLPEPLFDRLVREVENLLFVYIIAREHTRTFERSFARWAKDLRKVTNESQLGKFMADTIGPAKQALAARFDDAMRRMEYGSLQKYRLRYLLAKLTQFIEINAHPVTEANQWLSHFMGPDLEIEHIYPSDPNAACRAEFGIPVNPAVAQLLGNLVLIEKPINASISNRPYSEKKQPITGSKWLLTKSIVEHVKIGSATSIDLAVRDLPMYETWIEEAINSRQVMLTQLSRQVWEL